MDRRFFHYKFHLSHTLRLSFIRIAGRASISTALVFLFCTPLAHADGGKNEFKLSVGGDTDIATKTSNLAVEWVRAWSNKPKSPAAVDCVEKCRNEEQEKIDKQAESPYWKFSTSLYLKREEQEIRDADTVTKETAYGIKLVKAQYVLPEVKPYGTLGIELNTTTTKIGDQKVTDLDGKWLGVVGIGMEFPINHRLSFDLNGQAKLDGGGTVTETWNVGLVVNLL